MYICLYNFLMMFFAVYFSFLALFAVFFSKKYKYIFKRRLYLYNKKLNIKKKYTKIWVHALSVGEVFSSIPLIKEILFKNKECYIIFTVSTHAGYIVAKDNIASYVNHIDFLPYDIYFLVKFVIRKFSPDKVIFVETDLWPNILFLLKKYGAKIYLVNGKISDKTYKYSKIFNSFFKCMMSFVNGISVQSDLDRKKLVKLGVDNSKFFLSGNTKFDQEYLSMNNQKVIELKSKLKLRSDFPVWIAASIHRGEEQIILAAFKNIVNIKNRPALIVVPRNPKRAQKIFDIFSSFNIINNKWKIIKYSDLFKFKGNFLDIIIVDKIGILRSLYAVSNIVFVGGSIVDEGGHNVLEPAFMKKPVLFGPYTKDFKYITEMLLKNDGGIVVKNEIELTNEIISLINNDNRAKEIGYNAYKVSRMHRGFVKKLMKYII